MREIIRASAWNGFRELVDKLGGHADEILAAAQVDPAMLTDPERYLPLRAFMACQEIAAKRLGRGDFGLLFGDIQELSMLGPLSIAILNSPTAREGIEIGSRYLHVHNPSFAMTLTPKARSPCDFLSYVLTMARPSPGAQNAERIVASFHVALKQIAGPDYRPQEVWFAHKPLSSLSVYRKAFGVTPLFGKPSDGILVKRKLLDTWQPGRSPALRQIAESFLQSIAPPHAATYSLRVANIARSLLTGGDCSPEQVAEAIGVHPRTMQRRLKAEETSFEKIKDEVRRGIAETLLAQPNVSLSRIAHMLNYADSSAFSRSARRWFDESPSARRRRLVIASAPGGLRSRSSRVNSLEATRRAQSRLAST